MHSDFRVSPTTMATRWLDANWQYAGVIASCFYIAVLPLTALHWTVPTVLLWLQLPIYIAHQFEEHVHDRFRLYLNQRIGGGRELLTRRAVTVINIGGVWCLDFLAIYLAAFVRPGYGLLAFYLAVVNAVIHIAVSVVSRTYNPGLLTAATLLLPFGCWGAIAYSVAHSASLSEHLTCILLIVIVHAAIVAYMFRRRQ